MNERIEKLLDQCRIETYGVNGELLEFGFDAEKLAELIISECAALAKSKSECIEEIKAEDHDDHIRLQSLAWQFEEFGYEIKKHFGVKE